MTEPPNGDRFHLAAIGAVVVAVGCCAGIPLAVGAIAAIGGLAFGGIAAAVLLTLGAAFTLVRWRCHSFKSLTSDEPAP